MNSAQQVHCCGLVIRLLYASHIFSLAMEVVVSLQSVAKTHEFPLENSLAAMDDRVHRAVLNIQQSILVTTRQMAESANLSVDHFSRLFKKETGVSPHQYLKEARLNVARALLESSELSVKELSARSGFKDQSHFVRDFKKAYGLSPMQYRIEWRKAQRKRPTNDEIGQ